MVSSHPPPPPPPQTSHYLITYRPTHLLLLPLSLSCLVRVSTTLKSRVERHDLTYGNVQNLQKVGTCGGIDGGEAVEGA